MKSFVVAILLFTILVIFIAINSLYILDSCNAIAQYSDSIKNSDYYYTALNSLKLHWDKRRTFFGLTVPEAKIERMDELIISLFAATDQKNSHEVDRICDLLRALAEDISTYERISFSGIF